mgnify:CR=1 FL=1
MRIDLLARNELKDGTALPGVYWIRSSLGNTIEGRQLQASYRWISARGPSSGSRTGTHVRQLNAGTLLSQEFECQRKHSY